MEKDFQGLINDKTRAGELDAMWQMLDNNGNGIVSLAEIDRMMVSVRARLQLGVLLNLFVYFLCMCECMCIVCVLVCMYL